RAQRARLIDPKATFDTEPSPGWFASVRERVTDLFDTWFRPEPNKAAVPVKVQRTPRKPEPAESGTASSEAAASA
ncbi:hypothetical protein CA830_33700, partial [Burkholderia multivorans]